MFPNTVRGELCDVSKNIKWDWILNASISCEHFEYPNKCLQGRELFRTENLPLEVLAGQATKLHRQGVGYHWQVSRERWFS
jgi:hypothetical protein